MSISNVEAARRGFEALTRGDVDAVRELLDPDVKWHGGDPSAPGACRSRAEALRFIGAARDRGRIGALVEVIEAGERVVVVMRPPDELALRANVTTFRDGKVVEIVAYASPEEALAAAHG